MLLSPALVGEKSGTFSWTEEKWDECLFCAREADWLSRVCTGVFGVYTELYSSGGVVESLFEGLELLLESRVRIFFGVYFFKGVKGSGVISAT